MILAFHATRTVVGTNGDMIRLVLIVVDRTVLQTLQDILIVIKNLVEGHHADLFVTHPVGNSPGKLTKTATGKTLNGIPLLAQILLILLVDILEEITEVLTDILRIMDIQVNENTCQLMSQQ